MNLEKVFQPVPTLYAAETFAVFERLIISLAYTQIISDLLLRHSLVLAGFFQNTAHYLLTLPLPLTFAA